VARSLVAALGLVLCSSVSLAQNSELTIESPSSLTAVAERVKTIDLGRVERALSQAGLELPPSLRIILVDHSDARSQQTPSWIVGYVVNANTVAIFPNRIGTYPYDSLESVVVHEIAHVALFNRAGQRPLPRWFHEGVAVAVESGWDLGTQVRLLAAVWSEPAIEDVSALFASDDWPANNTAYLLSAALIADVRQRAGPATPGLIAARVAAGEPFETAFVRQTGDTPDEAARHAWRTYRGLRWIPVLTSSTTLWAAILGLAIAAFVVRVRRRRERRRRWAIEDAEAEDLSQSPPAESQTSQ
jgi:hypothetical protein